MTAKKKQARTHSSKSPSLRAFTVVELVIVITVIGVLAAITIPGYSAWKKRTYENVVKFNLVTIASAMENARNFGNAYPTNVPASATTDDDVLIVGGSRDGISYCVQATSIQDSSVSMYVSNTSTDPKPGNCSSSTGLVAWFPMNGNANDLSGKGNHGTATAVSLTTGQNGLSNGAYNFTGVGSYIVHGTSGILPNAGTVSVWVYPTVQNGWGVWQTHNSASVNFLDWIAMFAYSSGPMYFRMGNGTACCNNDLTYTTATYIPINQWSLLTYTWGSGTMKNYVNGTLINQRSATFQGVMDPYARIGTGHGAGMQGRMDDLRVYDRPLSDTEVQTLFSSGAQ